MYLRKTEEHNKQTAMKHACRAMRNEQKYLVSGIIYTYHVFEVKFGIPNPFPVRHVIPNLYILNGKKEMEVLAPGSESY